MITRDFTLGDGIDVKGTVIKDGVMRLVLNRDIIALNHDVRIQELAKRKTGVQSTESDPLGSMLANSAIVEMFCVLFAKTIVKFGDLDPSAINFNLLQDLTQSDMNILISLYAEMNGMDMDDIKRKAGEGKVPFAQSES
jgi:hypothetical protein